MTTQSHKFAFFCPQADTCESRKPGVWSFTDTELAHRLHRVLRLKQGEACILFGYHVSLYIILEGIEGARITFTVQRIIPLVPQVPTIDLVLPLLERPAFQEACSAATVLGVKTIRPVITDKTKRNMLAPSEIARLERTIIAAGEQSKQFSLPVIAPIESLKNMRFASPTLVFDLHGRPLQELWPQIQKLEAYTVVIGPEGDFTAQEHAALTQAGVFLCKLVPSVLRSEHAVMVGLGALRALGMGNIS